MVAKIDTQCPVTARRNYSDEFWAFVWTILDGHHDIEVIQIVGVERDIFDPDRDPYLAAWPKYLPHRD